ncbi:putative unspecific monooxygenase [Helianthus annuus]|uniref:Unspecific monooxygenase n=1 Tax=Helianthus annuus TaxID=4232 RepID=A0A9K3HDQ5_HELAN|nr:putative unspecific monooxygenase [Helianthus annuus]KAJ0483104.1 putative unspecific monooxygenase [Helianthus annuus]KAJ0499249.1 putative unspecific monooxygenase [Helianthus annuus]KAJ0665269.1 putative unspecific monooxygenase [Helianthus annuus]KAJ0860030.1 putative unspecific monooxygenase [Helianthus annuus]
MILKELSMLTTSSPDIRPLNLTFDDLKSLNYLHAALSESMRLFPPVPISSRSTVDDDILPDGTYVRKGWFVDYSVYAMGRMESLWGCDCREFKPERWLNDNGVYQQAYDPFGYLVFNGGLRLCMGKDLAYFQMKLVAVAVMHEFEIEVVGGGGTPERMVDPPYSLSLLLNMKNGLPVRVKKRQVAPVMLQELRMEI